MRGDEWKYASRLLALDEVLTVELEVSWHIRDDVHNAICCSS